LLPNNGIHRTRLRAFVGFAHSAPVMPDGVRQGEIGNE